MKIHVVAEAQKGCIVAVYLYEDLKAASDKLEEIKKSDSFNEDNDDTQLFPDTEITETQKFSVVEYRGDVAVNVLYSDQTQEDAARITNMLNAGMLPERRTLGYHYEMNTPPGAPAVARVAMF